MKNFTPGAWFSLHMKPKWQFWRRRRFAVAWVIDMEADGSVLHLMITGILPSLIGHLPIVTTRVEPYARGVSLPGVRKPPTDQDTLSSVREWRNWRTAGRAFPFEIAIDDAIANIFRAAGRVTRDQYIRTAYPTARTKQLSDIRVVVAPRD